MHKEETSVGQHDRDHAVNFTEVWAAARRKTLLLLWWIDGGKVLVVRSTVPGKGCLRAAATMRVWGVSYPSF